MLEIFTTGGGEYLVNTLNAVAAWAGGGGYRSLLQVVMVMGLIYALTVVAFSLDWRAWFHWFLQATLIYMVLMVPTTSVKVTDRINPSLAPAVVDNVPLGLGVMASFSSQIGDWMTRQAETVFAMPSALALNTNGIIYGARLYEQARSVQIADPIYRANLDEYMKQCVFYDVLLGFKSMDTIMNSTDLWAAIGPGSPARAIKYIEADASSGGTTDYIIPCSTAYAQLDAAFNNRADITFEINGRRLFPGMAGSLAAQKLKSDWPTAQNYMHGTSTADAVRALRQNTMMEAFLVAREGFSAAGWDAFAAQRADTQAKNTYTSIATQAMTWVPLLHNVLTIVFYAMFVVIFPLFLFPRTGLQALKGYLTGFFYLAAWGPLYVLLHMFVMNRAASSMSALAPQGPTLMLADGMQSVNNDIATVAGFLMMSVPFLAAGIARGAMALAGQATSMLQPAQSAAEASAVERTTGNYAYGNTSFANLTSNMRQANKWDDRAIHASGYPTSSFTESNGVESTNFANGAMAFNARNAISSLAVTPTSTASFDQRVSQTRAEGQAAVDRWSRNATESWGAVAATGTELLRTATTTASSGTETGTSLSMSLGRMNSISQSLSSNLSSRFGFSAADSQELANISQTTGSADAGLSVMGEKWGVTGKAGIGGALASIINQNTGRRLSSEEAFNEVRDFTANEVNSTEAREARENFTRDTSSLTNSRGQSLNERLSSNISHAVGVSREASRAEEAFQRFTRDFQVSEGTGYSVSRNDSQEFANFAQERMLTDPHLQQFGSIPQILNPSTQEQREVRDILLNEFVQNRQNKLTEARREMGIADPSPLDRTLGGPPISTEEGVRSFGERNSDAIRGDAPNVVVRGDSRDPGLAAAVAGRLTEGERRVGVGASALAAEGDGAGRQAADVATAVSERQAGGVLGNVPIISPLVEGARDRISGAAGWVADRVGLGGGSSGLTRLEPGQRAALPVPGAVSSGLGMRENPVTGQYRMHQGIDIAAASGTPIHAPASGEVIRSGRIGARGNFVELRHDDGSETRYFHMENRPRLTQGDRVSAGDVLGNVGSTGRSTGPHLHYEIWKDGRPLDPRRYSVRDRD